MKRLQIQQLRTAGVSTARTAQVSGVSPRTVERVSSEERVEDPGEHDLRARSRMGRPSKLADHEDEVKAWLVAQPELASIAVLERLRDAGYQGGKSAVYELVRKLRPPKAPDGVARFEAVPGEFSQHDFGQHVVQFEDGRRDRLHFFASRLKYSRMVRVLLVDEPVVAAERKVPQVALGVVVVDRDARVSEEDRELVALLREVGQGFAELALRQRAALHPWGTPKPGQLGTAESRPVRGVSSGR